MMQTLSNLLSGNQQLEKAEKAEKAVILTPKTSKTTSMASAASAASPVQLTPKTKTRKMADDDAVAGVNVAINNIEMMMEFAFANEVQPVPVNGYDLSERRMNKNYINKTMRSILFNWLHNVTIVKKTSPHTYFTAIQIVDQIINLDLHTITRGNFQTVGAAALYMASKYHDVYNTIELDSITRCCDKSCTSSEIVEMESLLFTKIPEYGSTTIYNFYELYNLHLNLPKNEKKKVVKLLYLSSKMPWTTNMLASDVALKCIHYVVNIPDLHVPKVKPIRRSDTESSDLDDIEHMKKSFTKINETFDAIISPTTVVHKFKKTQTADFIMFEDVPEEFRFVVVGNNVLFSQ
jgi:hypothetical protein